MSVFEVLLGVTGMLLLYALLLFILFIWISMFVDAVKESHWFWALLIVWLGWPLAFAYIFLVYKKSPVDELLIEPFRKGYKTGRNK